MYSPAGDRPDGAGSSTCSTRTTCSTRASSSTRPRSTPTCGSRWPCRCGAASASPTRTTATTSATAVHRCIGVGKCRADTTATGGVMCPSYLATRDEKDSTRGRARVLQELANGTLVSGWDAPEVAEALDLCLSCKGCSSDCPTGIDMATYKAEALYQRYRRRLRPASHYALGWLPRWAALTTRAPGLARLANLSLGVAPARGAGQARSAASTARRDLPTFAPESFRQWFAARRPAGPAPSGHRPAGAAVGGHVHQRLRPRGRPGRGPRARSGRLRRPGHRPQRLLRPDLDLHRPARRRPPPAPPHA